MAVGYVLINVKPGRELEVFESIATLDLVQDATLLFGDYDIIVKMTAGRMSDIAFATSPLFNTLSVAVIAILAGLYVWLW